jgi:hypothetical protein
MANTLTITSLAENLFRARDIVAKEPTGFIQGVMVNSSRDGASINGTVTSFRTAQPTLNSSYTPAMTVPDGDDQTVSADTLQLSQVANVRIPIKGETLRQLDNTSGGQAVIDAMFAQAIRKMRNAIELHCATIIYKGASRGVGTVGTTPFASNINLIADVRQILLDNGTPMDGDLSLALSTPAGTALRQVSNLYKANEAGTTNTLRNGELLNLMGFSIRESAQNVTTTAGTMANATSSNAAFTVGQTVIPLATAGTGVVAAGDAITFANDTNVYIVSAVSFAGANPASGDTITLASPGLRKAQSAATRAITVKAAYTANSAFHRSAVELAIRPPAQPYGGDAAVDRMTISDDTGLAFEVAQYKGYGMAMFDFTAFYQAKVWKPDFVGTIFG